MPTSYQKMYTFGDVLQRSLLLLLQGNKLAESNESATVDLWQDIHIGHIYNAWQLTTGVLDVTGPKKSLCKTPITIDGSEWDLSQ